MPELRVARARANPDVSPAAAPVNISDLESVAKPVLEVALDVEPGVRTKPAVEPWHKSATAFDRELIEALISRILKLTADVRSSGQSEMSLGSPADLAVRMVAAIPRSDPFNLELGPFYSTVSLAKWKGVTRQYIYELVKQRRILSLTTADDRKVYPSYQFGPKGADMPHLASILDVLSENADPWAQAMWFVTSSAALDGMTPAEFLKRGGAGAAAVRAARQSMTIFAGAPVDRPRKR